MDAHAVDEELCSIARAVSIISRSAPLNMREERRKFFNSYMYEPQFRYAPFDRADYEHRLRAIKGDETPLGVLFVQTRDYLLRQLHAVTRIGTKQFTDPALYGTPSKAMVDYAYQLLRTIKADDADAPATHTAEDLRAQLSQTLQQCGFHGWRFNISNDVHSTNVDPVNRLISINKKAKFSTMHIRKLQVHEIGTHVLRAVNGYEQEFKVFGAGILPGYLVTEEGLAAHHEKLVGILSASTLRMYAGRLIACALAQSMSFREVYDALREFFSDKEAWSLTLRVKRGMGDTGEPGGLFKDQVYLQGKVQIERYVAHGGDINLLYAGKIAMAHAPLVAQGIVKMPKYVPHITKKK